MNVTPIVFWLKKITIVIFSLSPFPFLLSHLRRTCPLGRRCITHPELSGSSFVCFFVSLQARRPGPTGRLRDSVVATRYVLLYRQKDASSGFPSFPAMRGQQPWSAIRVHLSPRASNRDVTCCCLRLPLSRETPDRVFSSSLLVRTPRSQSSVCLHSQSSCLSCWPSSAVGSITRFPDNLEQVVLTGGSSISLLQWLN